LTQVILYGKPGCHLCDEARDVLRSVRLERDFDLVEVDVALDPGLNRDYGERIPVVAVDGEDLFEYFVDRQGLEDRLDRVSS
jgi:glutaredoxin